MPISPDLLEILVCPETRQPLTLAGEDVVTRLDAEREAGRLRNRGGDKVSNAIVEGLIREDRKIFYVIDDGIPVMLIEESIEL